MQAQLSPTGNLTPGQSCIFEYNKAPHSENNKQIGLYCLFGHCQQTSKTSFNAIQHSFRGLQLLLNAKCMLFNRSLPAPARPTSITTLDPSDLEFVDNHKYLGVWLDCKLSHP